MSRGQTTYSGFAGDSGVNPDPRLRRLPIAEAGDVGGGAVALPAVELRLVLELLAAGAGDEGEGAGDVGEAGHVAPEFFELGDGVDVFLAVAPAFFYVFDGDVGG